MMYPRVTKKRWTFSYAKCCCCGEPANWVLTIKLKRDSEKMQTVQTCWPCYSNRHRIGRTGDKTVYDAAKILHAEGQG